MAAVPASPLHIPSKVLNTSWDRLPTPIPDLPHRNGGLLSPPRSRDPSPHRRPPSSPLSIVSSRLPDVSSPIDDVPTPGGQKTSAFFGSPFSSYAPTPAPPTRSNSLLRDQRSYGDIGAAGVSAALSRAVSAPSQSRSQTANADFFSRSPVTTPPLSLHSASSSSDDPSSRIPAISLSRLFPSRASRDPMLLGDDLEYSSLSRSSSLSSSHGVRRDFISIPDVFGGGADLSRSSSLSSTYKRDLANVDGAVLPPAPSSTSLTSASDTPSSPTEMNTPSPPIRTNPTPQPRAPAHLAREPHTGSDTHQTHAGETIGGDDVPLELIRPLGEGAFSSVWLARDVKSQLVVTRSRLRRSSESYAKTAKDRTMEGLKPKVFVSQGGKVRQASVVLKELDEDASSPAEVSRDPPAVRVDTSVQGQLVAVKMLDRALCDVNDRTRISFVREVEVLRHISHPSIVSYLHSFTTPTHHCLVLEHLQGGELFELLNSDENYAKVTEPLLRRMWGELCRAIGWMHGVALVHRDIKLENILLTCNPFANGVPDLATLPSPLVKLTDFGLARFIDPNSPMLTTRCGSEAYAAPEIVTSQKYDGRQTDAWACGVVLYALATRALPFDKAASSGSGSSCASSGDHGGVRPAVVRQTRRAYLMRIAKGDYKWPTQSESGDDTGSKLVTEGLKRIVGRLLVRDPHARARIVDLWDDEWMRGEGAPDPPLRIPNPNHPPDSDGGGGSDAWFPTTEAADVAGLVDGEELVTSTVVQQELL